MAVTTISSRELTKAPDRATRAADSGPVFITHRGRNAFVLLSIEEYQRITGKGMSTPALLAVPDDELVDFDPTRLGSEPPQPQD
jgi:hypothetical protein